MAQQFNPLNRGEREAWTNPQLFTTSLLALFVDHFVMRTDPEYNDEEGKITPLHWDAATVQMEVEQEIGVEMPTGNYQRLMVGLALMTTNSFYQSTTDFAHFCVTMSGHVTPPELMLLPDCSDLAWGITEGVLIMPPEEDEQNPFSTEIIGYIGQALDREGILNPPDVLRLATRDPELISRVNFDWSDDPEMFSGIYKMESGKTDDINRLIQGRLVALITQLKSLPLRNEQARAAAEATAQKMLQKLPGADQLLPLSI